MTKKSKPKKSSSLLQALKDIQKHIMSMTLFNDLLARAVLADDFSQGSLSKRINYLKETKEGLTTMDEFSQKLYDAGINDGRAEGRAEGKYDSIKNLMSTLSCSIDKAMDMLKTPPEERQFYKDMLSKNA